MATTPKEAPIALGEHRTVGRVMSILELVVLDSARGLRLGDLANGLDAPKSSVHGLAKGLAALGYLREEHGRYYPGPAISSLIGVANAPILPVYRHVLEQLSQKWSETAIFATLVGDSGVYLDTVEPKNVMIRAAPAINVRQPLWPRSAGKCFLAFMEPKKVDAYLARQKFDAAQQELIRAELATIRETRIAINRDASGGSECGVASPIILRGAPVTMAIAIGGLASRMEGHLDEIKASVLSAAESLSSRNLENN